MHRFVARRANEILPAGIGAAVPRSSRSGDALVASPGHLSQLSLTGRILHGKGFAFGRLLIAAIDKQSVLNIQGLRPVLPILQVVEVHTLLR